MSRSSIWLPLRSRVRRLLQWAVSIDGILAWGNCIPQLHWRLARPPLKDLLQAREVVILRYDGMGDLVLTSGMLRELRRGLPNARITLICQPQWASWMRTCPWVDRVVGFELKLPKRFYHQRRLASLLAFARREIWPLRPDLLLQPGTVLHYVESRALAWFTGAPIRLCWDDPDLGVDTGGRFHTRSLPLGVLVHETAKCFRMLEAIGLCPEGRRLDSWWTLADDAHGTEVSLKARGTRRILVALGLGGSEARKRWPRERFAALAHDLTRDFDVAFVTVGGQDAVSEGAWLSAGAPDSIYDACGGMALGELWALLARCDLYVGNDTGAMHMAAAARTPVVMIYGHPNSTRFRKDDTPQEEVYGTMPYGTVSRVVSPPADTPAGTLWGADLVPFAPVLETTIGLLREIESESTPFHGILPAPRQTCARPTD